MVPEGGCIGSSARAHARQQGLQQAASALFAVMAIVPLLVFAYTLWHLGALRYTFAQATLALTLGLALLGFWMFRSMLRQMSDAMQGMTRMMQAVARQPRGHDAPATTSAAAAATATPAPGTTSPAATTAPVVATTASAPRVPPPPKIPREVPGLGAVWELGEMTRTMDLLWQREAHAHLGRRVQVTVANAHELSGRLLEATADGLLLEESEGKTVAITYRRVQGIEPLVD